METIISPIDKSLLEKELTKEKFIRKTNNGDNSIYIFSNYDSPNLMKEIGRLRELTFRDAGGGTGKSMDIDKHDISETPFKQLIVWNPVDKEIIGGYRFIHCKELTVNEKGIVSSPTSKLFKYSKKFIKDYLPYTIELGRSFVQPTYQPTNNIRKGMYSLDNIWDGLGALVIDNPDVKYLFGKVTMYPRFDSLARDLVLFFMCKYFPDKEKLIFPYKPLKLSTENKVLKSIFTGCNYDEDYKILIQKVRGLNEQIPPLFNAYMNLSATMKTFGTAYNESFGNVEETGIIVTVEDIYDFKKDRHLSSYKEDVP
ncbi:MAG: GNAT family N-acetyltransferase [Bacteroidales bacterium]|nr:GNAT family N-acetyltransferase [Bacteroidales bacterium]